MPTPLQEIDMTFLVDSLLVSASIWLRCKNPTYSYKSKSCFGRIRVCRRWVSPYLTYCIMRILASEGFVELRANQQETFLFALMNFYTSCWGLGGKVSYCFQNADITLYFWTISSNYKPKSHEKLIIKKRMIFQTNTYLTTIERHTVVILKDSVIVFFFFNHHF